MGRECDFTKIDENGIQALEAFYFAVDQINHGWSILPGLQLSGIVLDTCRNPARTVRQMKDLTSGKIRVFGKDMKTPLPVDTVVGGASSDVSMAVAEFLAVHKVS